MSDTNNTVVAVAQKISRLIEALDLAPFTQHLPKAQQAAKDVRGRLFSAADELGVLSETAGLLQIARVNAKTTASTANPAPANSLAWQQTLADLANKSPTSINGAAAG